MFATGPNRHVATVPAGKPSSSATKQPSAAYKNLILVANASDFHVSQSIIIASNDEVNHFQFFEPNFEKPIDAAAFQFSETDPSVKNYRVIDADKLAGSGSAKK